MWMMRPCTFVIVFILNFHDAFVIDLCATNNYYTDIARTRLESDINIKMDRIRTRSEIKLNLFMNF